MKFMGYTRNDGKVGIRNHVLVLATSVCSNKVAEEIANKVVGCTHINNTFGCCQIGSDARLTNKTVINTALNGNVGAVVVVGLGCEGTEPDYVAKEIAKSGKPVKTVVIQKEGGTLKAFAKVGEDIRGGQPTPGNIEGGLTSIEEKSLGCIHKAGHAPITGVLNYADIPDKKGLYIVDTPGQDIESITGMVAGGAQIVVFTTGRGTPTENPIAPVIKLTGNQGTFDKMSDNIDLNVSQIISGEKSINEMGNVLFEEIISVSNGKTTKAEELGHKEFCIYETAPTF